MHLAWSIAFHQLALARPPLQYPSRGTPLLALNEDAGNIRALSEWITSSCGDVSTVGVGEVDGIRGCIVTAKLKPLETELMRVPSAFGITDDADDLLAQPLGAAIGRAGLALLLPDARLALRLLLEDSRGAESPWQSYIALLPRHVSCARHLDDDFLLECRSDFVLRVVPLEAAQISLHPLNPLTAY